eukprot:5153144-Amphidinium_carterae.1
MPCFSMFLGIEEGMKPLVSGCDTTAPQGQCAQQKKLLQCETFSQQGPCLKHCRTQVSGQGTCSAWTSS